MFIFNKLHLKRRENKNDDSGVESTLTLFIVSKSMKCDSFISIIKVNLPSTTFGGEFCVK